MKRNGIISGILIFTLVIFLFSFLCNHLYGERPEIDTTGGVEENGKHYLVKLKKGYPAGMIRDELIKNGFGIRFYSKEFMIIKVNRTSRLRGKLTGLVFVEFMTFDDKLVAGNKNINREIRDKFISVKADEQKKAKGIADQKRRSLDLIEKGVLPTDIIGKDRFEAGPGSKKRLVENHGNRLSTYIDQVIKKGGLDIWERFDKTKQNKTTKSSDNFVTADFGLITGRVINYSGTGIYYVKVTIYNLSFTPVGVAWTNSNGDYVVTGLSTGSYKVEFDTYSAPGYMGEWYNDEYDFNTADPVSVTAGSTTSSIDAQLAPAGIISGRVTNSDGTGVMNVDVVVYDLNYTWRGSGFTDSNGDYSIGRLTTGNYKVFFGAYAVPSYLDEWYNDKSTFSTADSVSVTAGSTTSGIDAELDRAGYIMGRVTDSIHGLGIMGVKVFIFDSMHNLMSTDETNSDGGYSAGCLPTGSYKVEFNTLLTPGIVGEWYNDKSIFDTADSVSVTAGSITSGIDAALDYGSIGESLTVTSPNGGESWDGGSFHNITWTSTGTIANVMIEYSTDNESNWTTEIASTPNDGSYSWTVPASPSTQCLVKISDAVDSVPSDTSNGVFSISGSVPSAKYRGVVVFDADGSAGDELFCDFGSLGLYIYHSGTWIRINTCDPDWIASFGYGGTNYLLADFGSLGLWRWNYNGSWTGSWVRVSNADAEFGFAAEDDGDGSEEVFVDFGSLGLWRYDLGGPSVWTRVNSISPSTDSLRSDLWSDGHEEGVFDFDSLGLWIVWGSPPVWTKLNSLSPGDANISVDVNGGSTRELVLDFDSLGLWLHDGSSWHKLNSSNPVAVAGACFPSLVEKELVCTFNGVAGLWMWDYAGYPGSWSKLNSTTPDWSGGFCEGFDPDNDGWEELAVDYGSLGLWKYEYTGGSWVRLTGSNPQFMVGVDYNGLGRETCLVVDFGPGVGLWLYDGLLSIWSRLSTASPDGVN